MELLNIYGTSVLRGHAVEKFETKVRLKQLFKKNEKMNYVRDSFCCFQLFKLLRESKSFH